MKRLQARYSCSVELALEFVGGKWKTVILAWLKEAPHRYGELRSLLPGITDKVLTQRLKDLEELELIEKFSLPDDPSKSAYRLTLRGESLRPALEALYAWGENAARELPVTIGKFETARKSIRKNLADSSAPVSPVTDVDADMVGRKRATR